jgi:hypothetical protein
MNGNDEKRIEDIEKDTKLIFCLIICLSLALLLLTIWTLSTQIDLGDSKNKTLYSKINKTKRVNDTFQRKSLENINFVCGG